MKIYNTQQLEVGVMTLWSSTMVLFSNMRSGEYLTIDNVSVKEYLGQEVVPDSGCGSWLWEPQTTNLVTYIRGF